MYREERKEGEGCRKRKRERKRKEERKRERELGIDDMSVHNWCVHASSATHMHTCACVSQLTLGTRSPLYSKPDIWNPCTHAYLHSSRSLQWRKRWRTYVKNYPITANPCQNTIAAGKDSGYIAQQRHNTTIRTCSIVVNVIFVMIIALLKQ